jgi:hypothetical protein
VPKPSTNQRKLCRLFGGLLILLNSCNLAPNRIFEESFERLYAVEPNTNVTIHNGDGSVLLYGSALNELRVRAVKKAYNPARLAQIAIDVSATPESVSITTKFPPKPKWGLGDRSGTVDYTIVVPASATVSKLELNAGEILLDGMRGSATRAKLDMGRMFARNCFSNKLDITIRRGNLMLSYDWWQAEQLSAHVNISQGNAWAYVPIDAAFHLLVEAEHGKTVNDFNNAAAGAVTTNEMKIDRVVNGGDHAVIEIRVGKGNINIAKANP